MTEGLTAAQMRVAELVAAGMTNRETAGALYMSTRTVESHLTKVYREYDVRSRAQLVSALAARSATDDSSSVHARLAGDVSASLRGNTRA